MQTHPNCDPIYIHIQQHAISKTTYVQHSRKKQIKIQHTQLQKLHTTKNKNDATFENIDIGFQIM
jgi:hypothetical protein